MKSKVLFTALMCIAWSAVNLFGDLPLSDPYRIMKNYYRTIGGIGKLISDSSLYYEGVYLSGGIKGTVKEWYHLPGKWRREVSVLGLKTVTGCNGAYCWEIDKNGKITIEKNRFALKRMKVELLMRSFEHMAPDTGNFTLSFKGTADVDGARCYVIRIANSIDESFYRYYINSKSFLLEKSIHFDYGDDLYTRYRDYRN